MKINFVKKYDTVVAGGGIAGCAAAIASARHGAKTALIEKDGVLGGQVTLGIVTPIGSTHTRNSKPFGGLCQEIIDKVSDYTKKYATPRDGNLPAYGYTAAPHITKFVLLQMCLDAGVDVLFHTTLSEVDYSDNIIKGITVFTKSGFGNINANVFIDATGDGDLIYGADDAYSLGAEPDVYKSLFLENMEKAHDEDDERLTIDEKEGVMQPASIMFRMRGVNFTEAKKIHGKMLKFSDLNIEEEEFKKLPYYNECGFEENGEFIPLPQSRVLVTQGNTEDCGVINMSRVIGINGCDADSLNQGECLAQMQVIHIIDFLIKYVPGFENAYLEESASTLGIRETRRLKGKYVLTGLDVIRCRKFEDAVARGSYMIDIHDPSGRKKALGGYIKGACYDIPFRCLESKKYTNLLACGRCISADHVAHSSTRIQGSCIMTGQAAGTAAALLVQKGEIDVSLLRKQLQQDHVNLTEE